MRPLLFLGAAAILALGLVATRVLDRESGLGFLLGALRLGGGLAISGFFSIRWKWHGIAAAGVLALLGLARGLGNLPGLFKTLAAGPSTPLPFLEATVTTICLLILIAALRALLAERRKKLLETLERGY